MIESGLVRRVVWLLFCAAGAVVLYLTLRPGNSGTTFLWSDKLQHASAYGTLSGLAALGASSRRQAVLFAALLAVTGYGLELIQPFVGRSYDLLDEAANIVGCIAGLFAARLLIRLWHATRTA